jgi:hypothetical protein
MRKHPHPTTIKIILRAREIITDPTHWTQGSHALDADGIQRHPWHSKAIRFTADAALWRAAHELFGEDFEQRDIDFLLSRGIDLDGLTFLDEESAAATITLCAEGSTFRTSIC